MQQGGPQGHGAHRDAEDLHVDQESELLPGRRELAVRGDVVEREDHADVLADGRPDLLRALRDRIDGLERKVLH